MGTRLRQRRQASSSAPSSPLKLRRPLEPPPFHEGCPWVAIIAAAACIIISVSTKLGDPDIWQHLVVGQTIWADHGVRGVHRWSWPMYGTREVTESWLFCAIIYPFWKLGGITGLFIWRWATTLSAFALLFLAARRANANVYLTLIILVWCSLVYRGRAAMRPETLAAVLLAAEILILERRRLGGRDKSYWLIPLMCVWTNANLSYVFGIVVIAAFYIENLFQERRAPANVPSSRRLGSVLVASCAAGLISPFGWQTMALPFKYLLSWRHELIFQSVTELGPIKWAIHREDGLAILMLAWVACASWRAVRNGPDLAELMICGASLIQSLQSMRFVGFFSLVVSVFLARDATVVLSPLVARFRGLREWQRTLAVSVTCLLVGLPTWTLPGQRYGSAWDMSGYPVGVADFMQAHSIRGHGFNYFWQSGYLLHRFWPDTTRLPFIDIHQYGSREDRDLHTRAQLDPAAWGRLRTKYHFDYVLLTPDTRTRLSLPSFIEHDSSWAMVFNDDAAVLYLRRTSFPAIAAKYAYKALHGSDFETDLVLRAATTNPGLRTQLQHDAERQVKSSPFSVRGHKLLGTLAAMEDDSTGARLQFQAALKVDPFAHGIRDRLGLIAIWERNYAAAAELFRQEYRIQRSPTAYDFRLGQVYTAQGDTVRARRAYEKALRRQRTNQEIRDSLQALGPRP